MGQSLGGESLAQEPQGLSAKAARQPRAGQRRRPLVQRPPGAGPDKSRCEESKSHTYHPAGKRRDNFKTGESIHDLE